jgi:ankyrin repeat protein
LEKILKENGDGSLACVNIALDLACREQNLIATETLFSISSIHPYAFSRTAFTEIVSSNGNVELAQLFLDSFEKAADKHFAFSRTKACLINACKNGQSELVRLLDKFLKDQTCGQNLFAQDAIDATPIEFKSQINDILFCTK